jgi:hypothetical protein
MARSKMTHWQPDSLFKVCARGQRHQKAAQRLSLIHGMREAGHQAQHPPALHCTALHCTALHWIWIWIWIWIWTACTGAALLRYQHFIEVSALTARKLQLIDCLSVVRASI